MNLPEIGDAAAAAFGDLPVSGQRSRGLWRLLETYHAVVYFAPERPAHYQALGLKGGWMGYFASRSAALGIVPPQVVTACFYNFKHTLVARALPDAWAYTTPDLARQARLAVFDAAIGRLLGEHITSAAMAECGDLAVAAVEGCDAAGRCSPHTPPSRYRRSRIWRCSGRARRCGSSVATGTTSRSRTPGSTGARPTC
jgi:hypothetical protein